MIEEKANGSAIIDVLRKQVGQIITPYNPKGGKIARAAAISHFVEALCVWVPDSAPWLEDFFAEVLPFPRGKFNDAADVLSMVLTKLANSDLAGQDVWDEFVSGRLRAVRAVPAGSETASTKGRHKTRLSNGSYTKSCQICTILELVQMR